ncbi:MAG: M56 family metallopeptidase [Lachnospiraceae bacterium]|nr:M56 family metallopeptidase [Lachnospiraceae bacterium]
MLLYQLFLQIVDMAVTACPVIIIVLFVRGIMYRLPKKYRYIIWLVVFVRLSCPVAVSSPVSLFNVIDTGFTDIINMETDINKTDGQPGYVVPGSNIRNNNMDIGVPGNTHGIFPDNKNQDKIIKKETTEGNISVPESAIKASDIHAEQVNPVVKYGAFIWLAGILFILSWNFYMLIYMKRHLRSAVKFEDNIYECVNIPSPFVTGILHPRIYIPFRLGEEEKEYILKHEKYHIKRRDYIIKPAAFLMACIYWFNPLAWISYFLMVRDMEMSCDEYVLQKMGTGICKDYSMSLLGFATNNRGKAAGLLSFGETDTRKRVANVLNFKKHGKWISVLAVILVLAAGAVCLTDAYDTGKETIKNNTKNVPDKDGNKENEENNGKVYGDIVAEEKINGYNVQVVHLADKEPPDKSAPAGDTYYSGDFVIRTYKDNVKYAEYKLEFDVNTIYYPKEGFTLAVKDYDCDGDEDDFAIGQSQTAIPECGNYMYYQFFTVDEDGSIHRYALSTEDGKNLVKIPGKYSPAFKTENGEIICQAITEYGIRKQYTNIVRVIPVNDKKASIQPMKNLITAIEKIMPQPVIDELHMNGLWRLSYGNYSLGNSENHDDITLRLDFAFSGNKLVQYVSKRYGFVSGMPDNRINRRQAKELVAEFEQLLIGRDIDKNNIRPYDGYAGYKGKDYAAFIDEYGNTFLVYLAKNMIINYDASEEWIDTGQETSQTQGNSFYFENLDVTIELPENKTWIQNAKASSEKNTGIVTFYDAIAKTEVKLCFRNKPIKELDRMEGSVSYENKYWSYFAGDKEKLIKIQFCKRKDMTTLLLSWRYNNIYFYMYTDFADAGNKESDNLEWQPFAKIASYVAEKWYRKLSEK